jgi:hypothetical protein
MTGTLSQRLSKYTPKTTRVLAFCELFFYLLRGADREAVEDAFLMQLFTGNFIQIIPGTDWLFSPMNGLLISLLFIALGVGLRQFRKRKMSVASKGNLGIVSEAA